MKLKFDIFVRAGGKFSDAAFDYVQWLSRQEKNKDIIRKLDEARIVMRGKIRRERQDRKEVRSKETHMSEEEKKEQEEWDKD